MKVKLTPIAFAFIILIIQPSTSKCQTIDFQTFIEDYIITFPENSELAIGIVDKDSSYTFGYRLLDGVPIPVNNKSTLFEIASISKVFTTSLLMKEVEKGTMKLDDPIQSHLSIPMKIGTFEGQQITLKHLATHTSGLKRNPLMSYERYLRYLKKFELDYIPGQTWEYNSLAIGLLASLIAENNQSSYSQLIRDNILTPLGMSDTYINEGEAPASNRVQCINKNGTSGDCYFHSLDPFLWPAGGLVSNLGNMMKWLKANLMDENIDPSLQFILDTHDSFGDSISIPWFEDRYSSTQGIGWWHYKTSSKTRYICHGGNNPQQTSFMEFDKTNKRGVVILANVSGKELMDENNIMKTTDLSIQVLEMKD